MMRFVFYKSYFSHYRRQINADNVGKRWENIRICHNTVGEIQECLG
jgi:hypothetical protein